MKFNEVKYPRI